MLIVPIGGGGLSSGIITGLCQEGSKMEVWGAEPALGNDAARSLKKGVLCRNDLEPQSIADGARTLSLGVRNWKILKVGLHGIHEISEAEIARSLYLLGVQGIRVEPTGALAIAAGIRMRQVCDHRIACVISGGHVDEEVYERVFLWGKTVYSRSNYGTPMLARI